MDKDYAKYLLEKTKDDYNLIADDFSNTRNFVSENLLSLEKYAENGNKVLDLGCGNGRLSELFFGKNIEYVGVDVSEKMVDIAKRRYPHSRFLTADSFNLPFPDDFFDKIFCLAVLHHIPSREMRASFLSEAKRVLKPKGLVIVSVWNLWHLWRKPFLWINRKRLRGYFFRIVKHTILKLLGASKLDFKDIFMPWGNNVLRYIHCFDEKEFKETVEVAGLNVKNIYIGQNKRTKESGIYLIAEQ